MPKPPTNEPPLRPQDVVQRVVEGAGNLIEERESSKRSRQTSKRPDAWRKSQEFASVFWKLLVKNVGESDAKNMMRHIMGDKKPGKSTTDQDVALSVFVYAYILHLGRSQTDGKIASRLLKSSPYYLQFESGAVAVANSEFTEEYMSSADDPIVARKPIALSLAAIEKRVERMRRWAIEENLLPTQYAPRAYHRD